MRPRTDPLDRGLIRRAQALVPGFTPRPASFVWPGTKYPARSLQSSIEGVIARVLFSLSGSVLRDAKGDPKDPIGNLVAGMMGAFREDTLFTIAREDDPSSNDALDGLITTSGVDSARVHRVNASRTRRTLWASDPMCMTLTEEQQGRKLWFTEPGKSGREEDETLADDLEKAGHGDRVDVGLPFQGGDMLIGDDFVFIGQDSIDAFASAGAPTAQLDAGREFIPLGAPPQDRPNVPWSEVLDGEVYSAEIQGTLYGSAQPLYHIDLFVSLALPGGGGKRGTVLVADPDKAHDHLGRPWPPGIDPTLSAELHAVAKTLEAAGFSVVRNPVPLLYEDDTFGKRRAYYFGAYNNVVVEHGRMHAMLPTYGDEARPEVRCLDEANAEIWRSLGYTVTSLPDSNVAALSGGGPNCLKNVLRRG